MGSLYSAAIATWDHFLINDFLQSHLPCLGICQIAIAIYGGTPAAEGQFPSTVSIRCGYHHHCGGVIITDAHILTAASCFLFAPPFDRQVAAGMTNQEANATLKDIINIVMYPDFSAMGFLRKDVAILQIAGEFEFSDVIQPVSLPTPDPWPESGQDVTVVGWGAVHPGYHPIAVPDLMMATVEALNPDACTESYGASRTANDEFCDASKGTETKSCMWDNGGPVYGDNVLLGIINNPGCLWPNAPDVNTNIGSHVEWIQDHLELVEDPRQEEL